MRPPAKSEKRERGWQAGGEMAREMWKCAMTRVMGKGK